MQGHDIYIGNKYIRIHTEMSPIEEFLKGGEGWVKEIR